MAGPFGDLADGWEENQTLVGGVLFFLCLLLQIPSYCFSRPVQEKSVPFFAARCMSPLMEVRGHDKTACPQSGYMV